jgi:hypothetical protein
VDDGIAMFNYWEMTVLFEVFISFLEIFVLLR